MAPTDWRRGLTFSDRLGITSQISDAKKKADQDCTPAEASEYAKDTESTLRKEASTIEEYRALCAKTVRELLDSLPISVYDEEASDQIFADVPTSGIQIGPYKNASHYSDGLFSEVFKAVHAKNGQLVALKVASPGAMGPPHDIEREVRILTTANHPHIIPLLEHFPRAGGQIVLAFPFMPFGLDAMLRTNQLDDRARRTVLKHLFTALEHLHGLGIIHRDIKPSNILLASPQGPAYLADFGIAWSPDDSASEPAYEKILDVGTTCYRPPELLFGGSRYGPALDMWAAGCVAAQVVCLNGRTLFDAGDLGSELSLIRSIFETLGTPDEQQWPEVASFPDWGKMNFKKYPGRPWDKVLPGASAEAVDLVRNLVVFESSQRRSAREALAHPFLRPSFTPE